MRRPRTGPSSPCVRLCQGYERDAKQRHEFRAKIIESTAQFRHLASRMRAHVQLVATSKQAA
jgi:hypothetical protein